MRLFPLIVGALALAVLALLTADPVRVALALRIDPPTVGTQAEMARQVEAAERAIGRGHAKAIDQLRSTANVRLPITAAQAAAIEQRALADLRRVRRAALADLAAAVGVTPAEAVAFVDAAERRLDGRIADDPGPLLAPGLFTIVSRADQLLAQVADQATRELTTAAATPTPTPTR